MQGVQIQAIRSRQILIADGNHALQPFRGCFENRGTRVQRWLLCDEGNAYPLLNLQRAIVRFGKPSQDFEKGRLPCAIAANQAYPLSSLQGKAGVIQQCNMPKCELGVQ